MDSEGKGREGIGREGPDFLRECLALPEGGRNYWKLLVNLGEASQDPLPASLLSPSLSQSLSPPSLTVSTFSSPQDPPLVASLASSSLSISLTFSPTLFTLQDLFSVLLSSSSPSLYLLHCFLKCVFFFYALLLPYVSLTR